VSYFVGSTLKNLLLTVRPVSPFNQSTRRTVPSRLHEATMMYDEAGGSVSVSAAAGSDSSAVSASSDGSDGVLELVGEPEP